MELEVSRRLENEAQFWDELDRVLCAQCDSHAAIDNVLRAYLDLTTKYQDDFLRCGYDLPRCSSNLLSSALFSNNGDYIRQQIIHSLLQEDEPDVLHVIASLLLFDGRQDGTLFEIMNREGAFGRLIELIRGTIGDIGGAGLHQLLMELFYEMSRIQRIKIEDLSTFKPCASPPLVLNILLITFDLRKIVLVDDDFIKFLFEIVEEVSDDVDDPYHSRVIRVLLVLNEQFMVSAHDPIPERPSFNPPTNKVIKVLSMYGSLYKTFGENIILLLNRENETSLQLLTLKLLYLLFTTPPTYEYFYTNDLRVLVDILIRNLLDLPEEASALRHTYLRVLHPLLTYTQLKQPPHYKRDELRRLFGILIRDHIAGYEDGFEKILHFDEVDETTKRLVLRCAQVDWLIERDENTPKLSLDSGIEIETNSTITYTKGDESRTSTPQLLGGEMSSTVVQPNRSEPLSTPDQTSNQFLGADLEASRSLSVSMTEIATHREKPGVMMPRKSNPSQVLPKQKPEPPKSRRLRGRRGHGDEHNRERHSPWPDQLHEKQSSIRRASSESPPISHEIDNGIPSSPTTAYEADSPVRFIKPRAHSSLRPPAVPPPRRSSQSVPPSTLIDHDGHHSPNCPTPPSNQYLSHSKLYVPNTKKGHPHPHKPRPPKTRRWRAHLLANSATEDKSRCSTPQMSLDDTSDSPCMSRESPLSASEDVGTIPLAGINELERKVSAIKVGDA
ncbi:pre-rRNA processing [Ophidiomyces ophidiicola]|nr:pre-rRNA processing [Ophidiomyces ophidiicola]